MSKKRIVVFGYSGSVHIKKWSKSLVDRGYDVRIISLEGDDIAGVDVVKFSRTGKLSYFKHAKKAVKTALEFKPDILHVHYAGGYGIWGVKANFHPLVVSVWGSDVESLPNSLFYRPFIKSILSHADIITATSSSLKRSTVSLLKETNNKIKVVPFGVKIPDSIAEFPQSNNMTAIFLKHLEKIYAPDLLIKAFVEVKKNFPNFKLTICGEGSQKDILLLMVKELEVADDVNFTGHIENNKIYDLIRQHHFMVMPSLKEGFGVAAVEAFACARPVVASNVGGIPEIVTDGLNGYLVKPNNVQDLADAIIKMISDRERMVEMGRNGYESVKQKYDWEKCVDQMIEVYENL